MGSYRQRGKPLHVGGMPEKCGNRVHLVVTIVFCLAGVSCDSMARLKTRLRTSVEASDAADPVEPGRCGLDVIVTPPSGMTVLVDGAPLSHASPACHRSLAPGPHTVDVRAMGYVPIILPIHLKPNETLRLPVALRARAPGVLPAGAAQSDVSMRAAWPPPAGCDTSASERDRSRAPPPERPTPVVSSTLLPKARPSPCTWLPSPQPPSWSTTRLPMGAACGCGAPAARSPLETLY